jgi:V/A-type H+/Na+-transporting ATPase subunit E
MELQVQELLERIKADGVEAAKAEASAILAKAEREAQTRIAEADVRAKARESEAEARIATMEKAAELALSQASRDAILSLRQKVQAFMEEAIRAEAAQVFDATFLTSVLPDLLKTMCNQGKGGLSVLLPEKSLKSLDSALAGRLAKELGRGVEFKPFAGLDSGFRIVFEGEAVHYDFSAQAVASILSERVGEHLASSLKRAAEKLERA